MTLLRIEHHVASNAMVLGVQVPPQIPIMKLMITGHRFSKLTCYDIEFIKLAIWDTLLKENARNFVVGLSGMASGVDLWFCDLCRQNGIIYIACPPFLEQRDLMIDEQETILRDELLKSARETRLIRNSEMIRMADLGIVVWDGNKGGTHNAVQQLIENKKGFYWINPVSQKIWECF